MAQQNLTAEQQEAVIQKVGGWVRGMMCVSPYVWGMKPIYTYIRRGVCLAAAAAGGATHAAGAGAALKGCRD